MVDLLQPIRPTFLGTLVLLLVLAITVTPSATAAQTSSDSLDGRLGGTFASFVDAYGEPTSLNPAIGEIFDIEGYGLVAAQFSRLSSPSDDESPALLITLRSERDPDVPATTPDDADWTIDEAVAHVTDFVPADAALTDFTEGGDGTLSATCTSDALAESFGQLGDGGCSIRAVQSESGKVSFITLSLVSALVPTDVATPVSECQGVAEWAQESGARLTKAQDLLQQLTEIDPESPTASDDLAALQDEFTGIAADQRGAETPAVAVTANFYLIGAFSEYAAAVGDAATGITTNDQDAIDRATEGINDANAKVERASSEIEQIVSDCGLEVVPEATPIG
jgi:hypothetical protein